MRQFDKANIGVEWMDLVNEFPEFFLTPSSSVVEYFNESKKKGWRNCPENYEDLVNLRLGFECNIGWKEIIRDFCESVRFLIKKANENNHEIFYSGFIIKEKFGECVQQGDFYGKDYKLYWDEFCKISENLRDKSSEICEITGKPGKLVKRNYWCKTLCEEEAEKWTNYK
jgi:hypothetical protein